MWIKCLQTNQVYCIKLNLLNEEEKSAHTSSNIKNNNSNIKKFIKIHLLKTENNDNITMHSQPTTI